MKQLVDLIVFLTGIFYLFIGWGTVKAGNPMTGDLLYLGSILALVGVLLSLRQPKKIPNYLVFGGIIIIGLTQLTMGSILFAILLGILAYLAYLTRKGKVEIVKK